MGDADGERGAPEPLVYIAYSYNDNESVRLLNDPDEVAELYGVMIVSYEYDEPIKNTFTLFNF